MSVAKQVGKLGWLEVTALQQLCHLRKKQLAALETNVYVVRVKDSMTGKYVYKQIMDCNPWGEANSSWLQIYPSFEAAECVRKQCDGLASAVFPISKKDLLLLPCFSHLLRDNVVDANGNFAY
jgi:hypothetical protein